MNIRLVIVCVLFFLTSCMAVKPEASGEDYASDTVFEEHKDEYTLEEYGVELKPVEVDEEISAFLEKKTFIADMLNDMTLEEKIGQMFICSFETNSIGLPLIEIDKKTLETVKYYGLGGIIYFAANIDDAEQTLKLSEEFQAASAIPLFIAVDEEGGRVSRITKSGKIDFQRTKPAKAIGNTGDTENAYLAASAISEQLRELGINLNFAPCADVAAGTDGAIGDRAFSEEPSIAARFVNSSVYGYNDNGIICTLKHFPGHGAAPEDTHLDKVISQKSLDEILESDIIPFVEGAASGAPMIMLSHITVPEWGVPASISADAVNYIRMDMGYDGVIITDSFKMRAITEYYTPKEAAVSAIDAGVNIVLMPESIDEAVNGVKTAVTSGELDEYKIDYSVLKILSLKYDYGLIGKI